MKRQFKVFLDNNKSVTVTARHFESVAGELRFYGDANTPTYAFAEGVWLYVGLKGEK